MRNKDKNNFLDSATLKDDSGNTVDAVAKMKKLSEMSLYELAREKECAQIHQRLKENQ